MFGDVQGRDEVIWTPVEPGERTRTGWLAGPLSLSFLQEDAFVTKCPMARYAESSPRTFLGWVGGRCIGGVLDIAYAEDHPQEDPHVLKG